MPKKAIVIGAGFAGISAASFMAKAGWQVQVLEKHAGPGGRARQLVSQGFFFDMGPSWYWMPEIFERYFQQLGRKREELYTLTKLDPSYRIYWPDGHTDLPASLQSLQTLFEKIEPGAGRRLQQFIEEAEYKYNTGMHKLVFKPGLSLLEFLDADVWKGISRLSVFGSLRKHIYRYFQHPQLRQLLEFPVLFLGALPQDMPALYSLMNYADIVGGTWYPQGGMYSIVQAMEKTATGLGVQFHYQQQVRALTIQRGSATEVITETGRFDADVVICGADYHHAEMNWLPPAYRSYTEAYWQSRVMAPSCLLFYVGLNKRIPGMQHHTLFFDTDFETHANEIYRQPSWPSNPMFYVCAASVTDKTVAPENAENLFLLVPVAAGLEGDSDRLRETYFDMMVSRLEQRLDTRIRENIVCKHSFGLTDFSDAYHSFKGNAYGLANTLRQTALLKPSCRSKKVKNLFYTGQLTVPGPGVPPSLISGEVVAGTVLKYFG